MLDRTVLPPILGLYPSDSPSLLLLFCTKAPIILSTQRFNCRGERGPESSSQGAAGAQQQAPLGGGLLSALGGGDLGGLGGLLGAAGEVKGRNLEAWHIFGLVIRGDLGGLGGLVGAADEGEGGFGGCWLRLGCF